MKRAVKLIIGSSALIVSLLAQTSRAAASDLTFDDVAPSNGCNGAMPSTYGGLNVASGFLVECHADFVASYGNSAAFPSGDFALTNSSDVGGGLLDLSIGAGTFDFNSASFSSFADSNTLGAFSAQSLQLIGYRPGDAIDNPTYVTSIDLDPTMFILSTFNWTGITDLFFGAGNGPAADSFTTFGVDGVSWLMDSAQVNVHAPETPVPEPSSIMLFGSGLAALTVLGRRSKRRQ